MEKEKKGHGLGYHNTAALEPRTTTTSSPAACRAPAAGRVPAPDRRSTASRARPSAAAPAASGRSVSGRAGVRDKTNHKTVSDWSTINHGPIRGSYGDVMFRVVLLGDVDVPGVGLQGVEQTMHFRLDAAAPVHALAQHAVSEDSTNQVMENCSTSRSGQQSISISFVF